MENVVIRPFIKILPRHKALIKSSLLLPLTPRDFNSFLLFLFIEVQVQKRLRSMSQSIIISRVVLDPLRISFTLGHPFQIQFSGEL